MADWVVADDIGQRLAELRSLLGENQKQFAKRFGRTWKRVSAWENGDAVPPQSALQRAADAAGWDTEMFADGGPYPKQALKPPTRPAETRTAVEPTLTRSPGRRADDRDRVALASRMEFLRDQFRAYAKLRESPSPQIVEEWLRVAADALEAIQPRRNGTAPDQPPP